CVGTTTMDHISQLPTDILCYVISKLSLRDAVRTRTLSHRWKCLSSSQSGLIFDKVNMFSAGENYSLILRSLCSGYITNLLEELINFLNII
ncbi:hypothetical protein P3X46_004762, partial [Hevea brasiliensis]